MELSASLWLYLIALSLRLTIWKEGSKDFLVRGCMQAVARMHKKILVENGLAQMTSEGSSSPEMHSTALEREGESGRRIGWAEFRDR